MAGLGNPLSFVLGGGPAPQEMAYDALYQAVGDGIQADAGTIVEAWRMARSRGIAAANMDERAMLQAFPNLATDMLSVWEEILEILPSSNLTDTERRKEVVARYTRIIDATYPKLNDRLESLDPLFSIVLMPHQYARVTEVGVRAFEDWNTASPQASGPAFNLHMGGDAKNSIVPNFSDHFIVYVQLGVGPGSFSLANQRAIIAAQTDLNESLPAWVDFRIYTQLGFILDQDLLDVTAFGDGVTI